MTTNVFKIDVLADTNPETWVDLSTLLANTEGLSTDPEATFAPYADFELLANTDRHGVGAPVVTWKWKALRPAQREALRAYCPGLSATVHIRTRTNETATGAYVWKNYRTKMYWMPHDELIGLDAVEEVDLEFRHCVELT